MNFSTRLKIALQISKLGTWGNTLALGIMTEENLVEWNRHFAEQVAQKRGPLTFDEVALSNEEAEAIYPTFSHQPGDALVLGSGEGRESIALALQGWTVTGIENSKKLMIEAQTQADNMHLSIDFISRDIAKGLPGFASKFDLVCMLGQIYSYIPTTKKRINLLEGAKNLLKPGGKIILNAPMVEETNEKKEKALKWCLLAANLTGGFKSCELGDSWNIQQEYHHQYPSFEDFDREIRTSGLIYDGEKEPSESSLVELRLPS